ncbi:MAG: GYF domain-containing protein [Planctomycetaceae bacterium]|jgi:TM2 domain-containing membrane protein YozV|nr:GYF domain-containing protein [Planctomycetaceae bacterium]
MSYYIKNRGKAFGPFNEQQLIELKMKGKISRNVDVSEDQTNWFTAENLSFLYDEKIPPPPPPEPSEWFYSTDGDVGYGPVTKTVIHQMVQKGTLTRDCYVWKQGEMAQVIYTVPEFAVYAPPPKPIDYEDKLKQVNNTGGKYCFACGAALVMSASTCPTCGTRVDKSDEVQGQVSRLAYILLAIFFGGLGVHDFYAGRIGSGVAILLLTFICLPVLILLSTISFGLLSPLLVLGGLGMFIFIIVEICAVTTDGKGRPFV